MGNELLTIPAAGALMAAAGAGVAAASAGARKDLDERRAPLLGVLGAFVFAGQMVNFPILPGTSGHFLGAALLAVLLGPHAAALGMAAIVIVQCLVFQDGGLLALGANLLNMALVAPYAAWAVFRTIGPGRGRARFYVASFAAAMASVLAGAILVALEVSAAGRIGVPWAVFLGTMAGIHAVIGAAEGAITFAVLAALGRMRPELLGGEEPVPKGWPLGAVAATLFAAAVLTAGFLSLAASQSPDGLDSALAVSGAAPSSRDGIALFPDYTRPGGGWYWTTIAGVLGVLLVLALGRAVLARRKA